MENEIRNYSCVDLGRLDVLATCVYSEVGIDLQYFLKLYGFDVDDIEYHARHVFLYSDEDIEFHNDKFLNI